MGKNNIDILALTELLVDSILIEAMPIYRGERSMECFDKGGREDFNPVTLADKGIERRVRSGLEEIFVSNFSLQSEEVEYAAEQAKIDFENNAIQINFDPIDGTKAFCEQKPGWACQIGWLKHGKPMGSIIVKPEFDHDNQLTSFKAYACKKNKSGGWNLYKLAFSDTGEILAIEKVKPIQNKSNLIIIQTSGFSREFAPRLVELWQSLVNLGYEVQESRSFKAPTGIGTSALDILAVIEGRAAAAIISNNLPHDLNPGGILIRAHDMWAKTFEDQRYFSRKKAPGFALAGGANMSGYKRVREDISETMQMVFGDLFDQNIRATLPDRSLPTALRP